MSLSSALAVSLSGIQAMTTMLEVTASNISNATTEGYTTKRVGTAPAVLGETGGGVEITGFTRAENKALFTTLTKATSNSGLRSAQDNYLQLVQDIFGSSSAENTTLAKSMSSFVNAWTTFETTPESLVNARQVVQDATSLAEEIRRISNEVESLDRQCQNEISSTVSSLNSYLNQIKDLNTKISQAYNAGLSTGNLEDDRDRLIMKVAEITSVNMMQRESGQIALYTTSGYQLVDIGTCRTFSYNGTDITSDVSASFSLNGVLTGGSMQGLVYFRATTAPVSTDLSTSVIQKLRDQLDEIANAFLSTVTTATSGTPTFAQAYNAATTAAGELAANFFTGANRTDIAVNASLLNGTAAVKAASATDVVEALLDDTRAFTADGLSVSDTNYSALITASQSIFQQAANNIATLKDAAKDSMDYMQERFTNETSVNMDQELINLTVYQNSYAASARVMSVVQNLFTTLERLIA